MFGAWRHFEFTCWANFVPCSVLCQHFQHIEWLTIFSMPRLLIDMPLYFISNKRLQVYIPSYVFHTFLFIWQQSRYSIWAPLHPPVNFSTGLRVSDQKYNKSNCIKLTLLGILIINLRIQNVCIIKSLGPTTKWSVTGTSWFLIFRSYTK